MTHESVYIIRVSLAVSHMKQMLFGCRSPVDSLLHHHIRLCYEIVLRKGVSQA